MPSREEKLVEEVLSLHRSIRYCGVIDDEGEIITGRMKKGLKSLEPESQGPKLIKQLGILMGADKAWDAYLGKTEYIHFRKGRVNLLLFSIHGLKGVLVSTEPSLSAETIDRIRAAIDEYQKV